MQKLLMVDDDVRISNMVGRIARQAGVEFHALDDSSVFRKTYEEVKPDLIFLDIKMPNVDGIQLLRELKELSSTTPVYILSGLPHNMLHSAIIIGEEGKLNIKGYIEKPINTAKILQILEIDHGSSRGAAAGKGGSPRIDSISPDDLKSGMDANEISAHYQPKISLKTGRVIGVEALARWTSPTLGRVAPDVFVKCAEESGLIDQLTLYIATIIMRDARVLLARHADIKLSINISPALLHSLDFPDLLEKMVLDNGLSPESFILEITETADPKDYQDFLESMTRLRLKGFELALDDFGTGNSSTLQLFYLPITELKLDRRFVQRIVESEQARIIIRSTLELARSFGVTITAEGIENYNTLKWLTDEGCPIGQGYFIGRPQELAKIMKFTEFLETIYPQNALIEASPFFQRGLPPQH